MTKRCWAVKLIVKFKLKRPKIDIFFMYEFTDTMLYIPFN